MSQTYNLGKVAITPRGAYSSTAQYTPLDILSHNGSSYLVLQNCMGVTPPNATYYMVVASKGDTGSSGASPTIAAGTVTMTPAGTSASVTNVGTNVNASFNFTLPNGNVIYTGTGVTGTSTTPTVFSGSGVSNAGVGDIYFNTSTVAFYRCALGGAASTAKWAFLTYAVPEGSVTTAKIADSAVTTNKINNGAVTASKLGQDVTTVISNIEDIIADEFNPSENYAVGDYVIYGSNNTNKELYRFTSDKNAGAWDATKVESVTVCEDMSTKVDGYAIKYAGITSETYTTVFDTATVTTSMHGNDYPWAILSSTTDLISYKDNVRVTFDGSQYIFPCEMWFSSVNIGKSITFAGNATLWDDINGFIGEQHDDYPFLITGGVDSNNTHTEGLYLFTETAGSHTVKVELVQYTYTELPAELVCGKNHFPIYILTSSSGYNATSIGVNKMIHLRDTLAFGTNNTLSAQLAKAFGHVNTVSGDAGTAIGRGNTVSGASGQALGENNTVSGAYAVAIGRQNTSSENSSTALGYYNTASGGYSLAGGAGSVASGGVSTAVGFGANANHLCQYAIGSYNVPDDSTASAGNRGNYIEIVGNGTGDNARSNARTLDWSGNESLAGGITLGKGTADEVSLSAAQLKQLLALLT